MTYRKEYIDNGARYIDIRFCFLFELFHKQFHPLLFETVYFYVKRIDFILLLKQIFNIINVDVNEAVWIIHHIF